VHIEVAADLGRSETGDAVSRRLWRILLVLAVVLAIAAVVAYVVIGRFVNLGGQLGEGGEAGVTTPRGFSTNVFAEGLDGPRFINFGPDGVLHVADRGSGRILALPDEDGDGVADEQRVVAGDLEGVHSLTHRDGAWYAGVPSGVVRLVDSSGDGVADGRVAVVDDYPTDGSHSTRTVAFLPDGRMVVSIGSSCNVCRENDPRRAAIVVYDGPDGGGERVLASGLRNAVGLAVHPATGQLWATNNGRDLLGDDLPPETVYRIRDGADYGWPGCINGSMEDPDEGSPGACDGVSRPVVEMQAHSAPLGLSFYTGDAFPAEYRDDLYIALHGSWNRSELTGYKIVRLPFDGGEPAAAVEDFATGWLDETTGEVRGRPVGLAVGPDGALYVSDDKAGFIYRISYDGR
jgi:glucose/arabinose dehydrogenase